MIRPIELAPICLSLEEVIVCPGHKVLVGVEVNYLLIVSNPLGILDKYLRPHPIHFITIIIIELIIET
jgi:hypothetical protein